MGSLPLTDKLTRQLSRYLRYPDKNALLQATTATRFRELVSRRGLSFTDCSGGLRAIALGVCDYLAKSAGCPEQLAKMPLEGSIIPVVEAIFREGAAAHSLLPGMDSEMLGTTVAWAIFGAARRWHQTPDRIPAEEMATRIEAMVKPIFLGAGSQATRKSMALTRRMKNAEGTAELA